MAKRPTLYPSETTSNKPNPGAAPDVRLVRVADVKVPAGRRPTRKAEELAKSIDAVGLLNPITLTEDLTLIAGANRLKAHELLGRETIAANILTLNQVDAELAEIYENLVRDEGTELERAQMIARAKVLYEARHPEARRPNGGRPRNDATVASFSVDAAALGGRSQRTIQEDVQVATAIRADVRKSIASTPLADNKRELLALSRVEPAKQPAVVKLILKGEETKVSAAARAVDRTARREHRKTIRGANPSSDAWEVITGDCRQVLRARPAGWADLVFADPPFNIGVQYQGYDDDKPADEYLKDCREWMAEILRALRPGGSFYLAIGDEFAADLCCIARRELGLELRNWIVWHYTFGMQTTGKFARSHTHILYLVKPGARVTFNVEPVRVESLRLTKYGDHKRAHPKGKVPDSTWILDPAEAPAPLFSPACDTWHVPRTNGSFKAREGWHPCQMPAEVLRRIVLASSDAGDVVLDPFSGTAETGVAAIGLGRRYVGVEREEDYAEQSRLRLAAAGATPAAG